MGACKAHDTESRAQPNKRNKRFCVLTQRQRRVCYVGMPMCRGRPVRHLIPQFDLRKGCVLCCCFCCCSSSSSSSSIAHFACWVDGAMVHTQALVAKRRPLGKANSNSCLRSREVSGPPDTHQHPCLLCQRPIDRRRRHHHYWSGPCDETREMLYIDSETRKGQVVWAGDPLEWKTHLSKHAGVCVHIYIYIYTWSNPYA